MHAPNSLATSTVIFNPGVMSGGRNQRWMIMIVYFFRRSSK